MTVKIVSNIGKEKVYKNAKIAYYIAENSIWVMGVDQDIADCYPLTALERIVIS